MSRFRLDQMMPTLAGTWLQRPEPFDPEMGFEGVGIDSRENLKDYVFLAIKGERTDGHAYLSAAARAGATLLVVEREVDLSDLPPAVGVLKVDRTRAALVRLARAHRRSLTTTKVIAVTGSAGKTTTKRLLQSVLAPQFAGTCAPRSFNNDIGVPLTLLGASPRDRYVLVEIGTNAPGEISRLAQLAEPDIGVITMIGHSHLEGLGSVAAVIREKAAILNHLREDGWAIINADCPGLRDYLKPVENTILFGEAEDGDLRLTDRGEADGGWWFRINDRTRFRLALPGRHNAVNALAVVAVARRMGLNEQQIDEGLSRATAEQMRFVRQRVAGIDLFNDAYNANPESMVAALDTFVELTSDASRRILVLGDMLELGDQTRMLHAELGERLIKLHRSAPIARSILIGSAMHAAAEVLTEAGMSDRLEYIGELDQQAAARIAASFESGDAVLLKGSRGMALERIVDEMGPSGRNQTNGGAVLSTAGGTPSET
ncbi:MAG: UDP-N-acetylmuramoyl-tripeptide--D-alanyl-D-alanine ligase [Phycisphaerales bacterium]|nr:MAG: UDP-N-acetylmuramoyl-tripeptide--D-alanyl-D-alanine ligase [Phycisphaerales bacterium]